MQNLVVVSQLCAMCMHVGGPKKFEALGPCPFGWECGWPPRDTLLPTCCCTKFCHSRSNHVGV